MRTSPLHGEFDQLLLASSEGCGLHLRMRAIITYSLLLVSLVPRPPLDLPDFNVARKKREIERGPGDEATVSSVQP